MNILMIDCVEDRFKVLEDYLVKRNVLGRAYCTTSCRAALRVLETTKIDILLIGDGPESRKFVDEIKDDLTKVEFVVVHSWEPDQTEYFRRNLVKSFYHPFVDMFPDFVMALWEREVSGEDNL
jgi:hypothetical protein